MEEFRGWGGSGYSDVTVTPQGFFERGAVRRRPQGPRPRPDDAFVPPGPDPAGRVDRRARAREHRLAGRGRRRRPGRLPGSRSCSTMIPRSTTTRTRVRLAARRRPGASPAGTRATSTSTPSTRATPTRRCPRPSTSRSARWRAAAPARLPLAHRPQHRQRVPGARPLPRRPPGQPRDPERGGDNLSRPPQRPRGRRAGRLPDGSDPRAPRGRLARPDAGRTAGAQLPRGGARGRRPYEINHPPCSRRRPSRPTCAGAASGSTRRPRRATGSSTGSRSPRGRPTSMGRRAQARTRSRSRRSASGNGRSTAATGSRRSAAPTRTAPDASSSRPSRRSASRRPWSSPTSCRRGASVTASGRDTRT